MPPKDVDENDTDAPDAEEGPVLAPDDLDFSRDRRVAAIDEHRYVVSPTDERPTVPETNPEPPSEAPVPDEVAREEPDEDVDDVRERLVAALAETDYDYGFEVVAQFDGDARHERVTSNDVTESFDELLSWYARGISDETPQRDVLGILLAESDLTVRIPPQVVQAAIAARGLSPDDTVADLLEDVWDADGLELHKENHD